MIFSTQDEIDALVNAYINNDFLVEMEIRNGMTVDTYTKSTTLHLFINENYPDIDTDVRWSDSFLTNAARTCGEHYNIDPELLKMAYIDVGHDLIYYDKDWRERILKELDELYRRQGKEFTWRGKERQ